MYYVLLKLSCISYEDDFIGINFVQNRVRMRNIWQFEVEIKVHCYFEKINNSQSQTIKSQVQHDAQVKLHSVKAISVTMHVMTIDGYVAEG